MRILKTELDQSNNQLDFLTEIATLDRESQQSRLKEMEKLPLRSQHIRRLRALRSSLESSPMLDSKASPSPVVKASLNDFPVSHEILSEKLYDSVKMIRELMALNKKLKEQNSEMNSSKRHIELEMHQIQIENQELREKAEMLETILRDQSEQASDSKEITKIQREKQDLELKLAELEKERAYNSFQAKKGEWD